MRELEPLKPDDPLYLPREIELATIHYVRAYPRWLEQYEDLEGLNAVNMDGMPRGCDISRPTEATAIKRAELAERMAKIEEMASAVAPGWGYILGLAVTSPYNVPYADVEDVLPKHVTRAVYQRARRRFYAGMARELFGNF